MVFLARGVIHSWALHWDLRKDGIYDVCVRAHTSGISERRSLAPTRESEQTAGL